MIKTIIAIYGTANVGKSMTLARLGRAIQANGGITQANMSHNDYRAVFNYKEGVVGVQTFGDRGDLVREGLNEFVQANCDIIAIASKKYGDTTRSIENFEDENSYRIIWASPYYREGTQSEIEEIKDYTAEHYELMVSDIINGRL